MLLKAQDRGAFVFETETYSRKGVELAANPRCAMTLYWREVHRQVCISGTALPLGPQISDEMWARRGRPNQAASIAASEGEPIASIAEELELHAVADALAASPAVLDRPTTYQAFGLEPATIEFWEGSADRLHRRVFYSRPGGHWGHRGHRGHWGHWEWRRIQP